MLQRMEAQDEEFEARIRALEGWRGKSGGVSTLGAGAGGVVGGVVAVLGGG